jgi:hypothetical protein
MPAWKSGNPLPIGRRCGFRKAVLSLRALAGRAAGRFAANRLLESEARRLAQRTAAGLDFPTHQAAPGVRIGHQGRGEKEAREGNATPSAENEQRGMSHICH